MTLQKAIEIVTQATYDASEIPILDLVDALKLLIEAGKAVIECRASHMFCPGLTLPGETEE